MRRSILLTPAAVVAMFTAGIGQSDAPATVRFTYGGSGSDMVNAVTTDAVGNIYIAGRTTSSDLPGAQYGFQKSLRGPRPYYGDGFVAKLDTDGRVIWASYLGGNDGRVRGEGRAPGVSADEVRAIAVDAAGNVYVAGTTSSTDFPTTPDAFQREYQSTAANTHDGFLAKFDASGSELLYSTYIGVPDTSTGAAAVAVAGNGDAWVLVSTPSAQFPWTQDVSDRRGSTYLGHFPARGVSARWTRVGAGADLIGGVALDRFARPHVLTYGQTGSRSVVLTQLDGTGSRANFTWSLPLDVTARLLAAADLAIGPDGTIVIVGLAGVLPVVQPFQTQPGGNGDAFVAALNPLGTVELLSYLGGTGAESFRPHVSVDASRQVHVALDTGSFDLKTQRGVIPQHPDAPLYASDDRGRSWNWAGSDLRTDGLVVDFAFDARRDIVYALMNSGVVFRSTDRGATWQEVRRISASGGHLAADPRDPATLYAVDGNLYRLDRLGETITPLRQATPSVGGSYVESVAVSPHDGSVWVGTGSSIEVSFDRGASWELRGSVLPASPGTWAMDPSRAGRMVIGTNRGVYGTEDNGRSWQELTGAESLPRILGYRVSVALDPADSRRIYAGTFNRGVIVSDNDGRTWRGPGLPLSVRAVAVDPRPPHDVFAAATDSMNSRSGVLVSRDRGETWAWSLQTRDALTAMGVDRQMVFASGPMSAAPYLVRLDSRQGTYAPSFASYLMEGTLRDITTTAQGDSVLAFNAVRWQPDVTIVRIGR